MRCAAASTGCRGCAPLPASAEETAPLSALAAEAVPLAASAEETLPPEGDDKGDDKTEEPFPTYRLKRLRTAVDNDGTVTSGCSVAEDAFVIILLSAMLSRAFCAIAASNLADSSSAT